jgi:hypothetical protein
MSWLVKLKHQNEYIGSENAEDVMREFYSKWNQFQLEPAEGISFNQRILGWLHREFEIVHISISVKPQNSLI